MDIRFKIHIFHLLFLVGSSLHLAFSDGEFGQMSACCTYQDLEKADFDYGLRYMYNKKLIMEYNSTRGNWTGFTAMGLVWAAFYNRDPDDAKQRKTEKMILCSDNIRAVQESKNMTVAPSLKLTSVKQSSGTETGLLSCSAYNFYPKEITLTWLQNGQEVTSSVISSEVLSDGGWYYQIHSYLEYSPQPGEEISCMVEHVTLSQPLQQVWDSNPSLPWSEQVKIAVSTVFLALGLVVLAIGCVNQKKKSVALCRLRQGHAMVPVEVVHEDGLVND